MNILEYNSFEELKKGLKESILFIWDGLRFVEINLIQELKYFYHNNFIFYYGF